MEQLPFCSAVHCWRPPPHLGRKAVATPGPLIHSLLLRPVCSCFTSSFSASRRVDKRSLYFATVNAVSRCRVSITSAAHYDRANELSLSTGAQGLSSGRGPRQRFNSIIFEIASVLVTPTPPPTHNIPATLTSDAAPGWDEMTLLNSF